MFNFEKLETGQKVITFADWVTLGVFRPTIN